MQYATVHFRTFGPRRLPHSFFYPSLEPAALLRPKSEVAIDIDYLCTTPIWTLTIFSLAASGALAGIVAWETTTPAPPIPDRAWRATQWILLPSLPRSSLDI